MEHEPAIEEGTRVIVSAGGFILKQVVDMVERTLTHSDPGGELRQFVHQYPQFRDWAGRELLEWLG